MDFEIAGKTALVTASTEGIGYAIAKALADEGATVYINGRNTEKVEAAIKKLKGEGVKGELRKAAFDLSSKDGVDNLIQAISQLDILVNNLGIYEAKAFEVITDEDWYRFFEINVMSGIRLSRHYFPTMLKQNWGRVIFISSESGIMIPKEMIHYGFTKSAQLAVSRGMAELTTGTNVTVNSVLPGPTYSGGVEKFVQELAEKEGKSVEEFQKDFFKTMRPSSLIQRFATPDEVGALVAFVCSKKAAAINGAALKVEGGLVRSII